MGLGSGGDQGCLGVRLERFLFGTSLSRDSPVFIFDGPPAILAPAWCVDIVGETGDPRRGWAGMPRAEARSLAIEEDSRLSK